jgi:hypothetical protein
LVPPPGGVDWRLPGWLKKKLGKDSWKVAHTIRNLKSNLDAKSDQIQIFSKIQTPAAGEDYWMETFNSTYAPFYHDLFRSFFIPSPRLQKKIDTQMAAHGLKPGEYAAAHLRAMYGNRVWRDPYETIQLTKLAIDCASQLVPGGPVYFAADIKFAVDAANEYGKQNGIPVATFELNEDPIHFDKDDKWLERKPSAYDDTFIDLFLIGQSRCVTYSNGGFGTFGQLVSFDASCSSRFFKRRKPNQNCSWTDYNSDGSTTTRQLPPPSMHISPEMLVDPRDSSNKQESQD